MPTNYVRVNGPSAEVNANLQFLYQWNTLPTDFYYASLVGANLDEAILVRADLRMANLREVALRGADLRQAKLNGADLREARLSGADLREASLGGTTLSWAKLSQATYNEFTKWPVGFDPAKAGAILVD